MINQPSLRTGVYRLDIRKYNSDIAHLYEHLLLETFNNHLVKHAFSPYIHGWVGGETFRNVMFIDYGIYSSSAEKLFNEFMKSNNRVDLTLLDNEIVRLEAESNSHIIMHSKDKVIQMLKRLDKKEFIRVEESVTINQIPEASPQVMPEAFYEKRSKKSFRNVTIGCGIQNASLEEKAVFLRMSPLILDAISDGLFELGMYEKDSSWPTSKPEYDALYITSIFTIKRGTYTSREIKNKAIESLGRINLSTHNNELQAYIQCFVNTPNWQTFPIDYYRYSGMLVSKKIMAKLFTAENVHSILNKLEVAIRPTEVQDWS